MSGRKNAALIIMCTSLYSSCEENIITGNVRVVVVYLQLVTLQCVTVTPLYQLKALHTINQTKQQYGRERQHIVLYNGSKSRYTLSVRGLT